MILQELGNFYNRTLEESGSAVAPPGFQYQGIQCVIVLDPEGRVVALEETGCSPAHHERGRLFLVPKGVRKTRGSAANLLWDNCSYVLGHPKPDLRHSEKRAEEAKARQRAFIDKIKEQFPHPVADPGVRAVLLFLERGEYSEIRSWEKWPEVEQAGYNLTFRLAGDDCLVCQRPAVTASLADRDAASTETHSRECLVTGARVAPVRIHTPIKGVPGSLPTGAALVSFGKDAFCSFGWEQGYNAPVGVPAEFAYSTALNSLLAAPGRQVRLGDATAVFWSRRKSFLEEVFAVLFTGSTGNTDDRLHVALQGLRESAALPVRKDDDNPFFVLAMAPNVARLAVRLWYRGDVTETASHIVRYFEDCRIVHSRGGRELPSLSQLLAALTSERTEHSDSQLPCSLLRFILSGGSYPQAVLIAVLRCCRVEGGVTHSRAALIKSALARHTHQETPQARAVSVELDPENSDPGYLSGRLLCVLEKAQGMAARGKGPSRARNFGRASCTPAAVFPHLIRFHNLRLAGICHEKAARYLERVSGDLLTRLDHYPERLSLLGQAHFALGYYHQWHALVQLLA